MGGEARKTVTVVFIDVTGSTNLGESLDPEALTWSHVELKGNVVAAERTRALLSKLSG